MKKVLCSLFAIYLFMFGVYGISGKNIVLANSTSGLDIAGLLPDEEKVKQETREGHDKQVLDGQSGEWQGIPSQYQNNTNNTSDNVGTYEKVVCGDAEIPYLFPQTIRIIIVILQIATPIIVILFGSLDFIKAVMAQKEDDIKKGQQTFVRRLIVGAIVFLVFALVEFVIGIVAPKSSDPNMWDCVDCFVNGDCANIKK